MQRKYIVNEKTFFNIHALRREFPHLVCPPNPDPAILDCLGITVEEVPEQEPSPAQLAAQERKQKLEQASATASRKILAGFDYEINGEKLHFSYDERDQQNFADAAIQCQLAQARGEDFSIVWKGYKEDGSLVLTRLDADAFLDLYVHGALTHKAIQMEECERQKAETLAVDYPEKALEAELVPATPDEPPALEEAIDAATEAQEPALAPEAENA